MTHKKQGSSGAWDAEDLGETRGESGPRSVKGPMELNVILGQIEGKWKGMADKFDVCADNAKLVKALREARRRFLIQAGPETQCEAKEYDAALAAILNGEKQ